MGNRSFRQEIQSLLEKKNMLLKKKVWSGKLYQTKVNVVKPKIKTMIEFVYFLAYVCQVLLVTLSILFKMEISHMRILLEHQEIPSKTLGNGCNFSSCIYLCNQTQRYKSRYRNVYTIYMHTHMYIICIHSIYICCDFHMNRNLKYTHKINFHLWEECFPFFNFFIYYF